MNRKGKAYNCLLLAILALILFVQFRYRPQWIITVGPSMTPTVINGDVVLGLANTNLDRGDKIVFERGSDWLLKRIVGMPGEHIRVVRGMLFINGKYTREDYVTFNDERFEFVCQLGPDEFFVMGDNRPNSSDSRHVGPVKRSRILYEVKMRVGAFR